MIYNNFISSFQNPNTSNSPYHTYKIIKNKSRINNSHNQKNKYPLTSKYKKNYSNTNTQTTTNKKINININKNSNTKNLTRNLNIFK